jgi:hypothetical protein
VLLEPGPANEESGEMRFNNWFIKHITHVFDFAALFHAWLPSNSKKKTCPNAKGVVSRFGDNGISYRNGFGCDGNGSIGRNKEGGFSITCS